MKVGDVVINPFVSEYLKNGKINPNHKVMVVHVGTEYVTCLKCNGHIAKNYMHDIKEWEIVKHVDLTEVIYD